MKAAMRICYRCVVWHYQCCIWRTFRYGFCNKLPRYSNSTSRSLH